MGKRAAVTILFVVASFFSGCLPRREQDSTDDASPAPPSVASSPREAPNAPPPLEAAVEPSPIAASPPAHQGNVVHGRCVFKDGRAAAGARVRAWDVDRCFWRDEPSEIGRERVAGDDGRFVVEGCTRGARVAIYAALAGFQTAAALPTIWSERTDATITFGEGGVLVGDVSGPMGKPAGNVEVRLRPIDRTSHLRDSGDWRFWTEPGVWEWYAATTRTDGNGRYRFEGVPLPRNGAPQPRVPVAEVAGRFWRGEEASFETDGQEVERDIRIGDSPWIDVEIEALQKAVQDSRFSDAVRTFSALAQPTADDEYLVGHALMALQRPDEAVPHLEAAKARGWSKWPGWPSVESLLDRVAEVRRLAPPALDPPLDTAIEVHAGPPTEWSAAALRAVPEFAAVGRRIFGADLPRVRLYLFPDHETYKSFFRVLFGVGLSTSWQHGTGGANVVVFCEPETGLAGDPNSIGDVLHEFGHAWCKTYLMDRYGREWTSRAFQHPWLDEGIASVVASLREPGFLERQTAWLKTNAKSVQAPTFADLSSDNLFYKGPKVVYACYSLSAALVAELVGPGDSAPARIRAILDAVGKTGDVEASVSAATGKDLHKEFAKVVARFW